MTSDMTIGAIFEEIPPMQYTLTIGDTTNGSISLSPSGGTYNEGTVVTVTATPDSGYQFVRFTGASESTTSPVQITMNGNKTIGAVFERIQYTLTVGTTTNGSITLSPEGGTYDSGTVVTVTATPDSGYKFVAFTGASTSTTSPVQITMDGNKTIGATFELIPTYTLTIGDTENGSITLNPAGGSYLEGTEVTVTAVPDEGYRFVQFTGDSAATSSTISIIMNSNKTIGAIFEEIPPNQYALTIGETINGSITLDPAGGTYDAGTEVTVTAVPDEGYQFVEFTGDLGDLDPTENPITIIMDGPKTIGAVFEAEAAEQYTVTYDINGGSGEAPEEQTVEEGSTFTVASAEGITPPEGKKFKEWNTAADGTGTAYAPGATAEMGTSDITLYAIWRDYVAYTVTYNLNGGSGNAPETQTVEEGDTFEVATSSGMTAPEGKQFDKWNTESDGSGTTYRPYHKVTINGNITLYAIWKDKGSGTIGSSSGATKYYNPSSDKDKEDDKQKDNEQQEDKQPDGEQPDDKQPDDGQSGDVQPTGADSFEDLEGYDWAKDSIDALVKKGIISGTSSNTFEPGRNITRAEFAKLIVTAFGIGEGDDSSDYSDVNSSDWYYQFVKAAAAANIVTGYEDGGFKPNNSITRQEMAAIIVRAFKAKGVELPAAEPAFADNDEIGDWAKEYVGVLTSLGIVQGRGENKFAPTESLTRAEAAKVIHMAIMLLTGGEN